jgi:hypothetical protein
MRHKSWISTLLAAAGVVVLVGVGLASAAQTKKSVDQRVADLESKVVTLELELRIVKSELARTPRLGLQDAK